MSLAASFKQYKSELADTAARNAQYARPNANGQARSTTSTSSVKPTTSSNAVEKRSHDAAFPNTPAAAAETAPGGRELLTQVLNAVDYIKSKNFQPVLFDNIISYLSLPQDARANIPRIKVGLLRHDRVEFIPKTKSGEADMFKYKPQHPVSNGEELQRYLTTFHTAKGLSVRELKDGWPDCIPEIDRLESQGHLLVLRKKKENVPQTIWADSPRFHVKNPDSKSLLVGSVDTDFRDFWNKTKLPPNENDIRIELEKASITPTSAIKEMRKVDMKKKERKKVMRRGGKTTNSHMMGILKEYPGKR